jgi:hypothetical protein
MPALRVTNPDRGDAVLVERGRVARNFFTRGIGLLLDSHLRDGDGLLITSGFIMPSNSIHSLMMRFHFDAAFLDREYRVVEAMGDIPPWRILPVVGHAIHTLELPAGKLAATGTQKGDRLAVAY